MVTYRIVSTFFDPVFVFPFLLHLLILLSTSSLFFFLSFFSFKDRIFMLAKLLFYHLWEYITRIQELVLVPNYSDFYVILYFFRRKIDFMELYSLPALPIFLIILFLMFPLLFYDVIL